MSKEPLIPTVPVETDHEFKTRMAAEGKALYVPGKTDAEAKAARAAEAERRAQPKPLALDLSEEQLDALDLALPEACGLITDAAQIFSFLEGGLVMGNIDPEDHGLLSIMRMSARALRRSEQNELAALDMMDQKLRQARCTIRKEA
ncbi:hypothetical protein [Pararhodobacter marinus]|uniref:hypothetical protein n=1 Tax=Pararhodobacter marinus TaxID=2184063 RepID=UPI003511C77C